MFSWRYKNLGNLPHTESLDEYRTMNAGFVFNYQFIDVPDFNGIGEETPNPYFYQVLISLYSGKMVPNLVNLY